MVNEYTYTCKGDGYVLLCCSLKYIQVTSYSHNYINLIKTLENGINDNSNAINDGVGALSGYESVNPITIWQSQKAINKNGKIENDGASCRISDKIQVRKGGYYKDNVWRL